MNAVVLLSALLVSGKIITFRGRVDFLINTLIIYFSQIIASQLILGIIGRLFLNDLILLNLAILLTVWLIAGKRPFGATGAISGEFFGMLLNNKIALLGLTVLVVFASVKCFINLVNPPFGWDSLNYHFTFAVEWLKNGNLSMPITVSDDPSPPYYPINGSLYYLWLMFPLRNVFLADLGQLPFFALAFLAVFQIARKFSLNKDLSLNAAVLFLLIPNFFKQLQVAYVDVMVGALFLACVNYLCLLNFSFKLRHTLLFGLTLGLFLGVKTVALPFSFLLILPFACLCAKNFNKAHYFLQGSVVIFLFGGFSYCRNFLQTGNPLYPLNFGLFSREIFKGVMDKAIYSAHFTIKDYSLFKLLFKEGLGAQTLLFIFPAVFLALPLTIVKRKKLNFTQGFLLVLPLLIYLVYRFLIPLANTRYLYALLGIGIILGFYLLNLLKIHSLVISGLTLICIVCSIPELAKRQELITSIILTAIIFCLLISYKNKLQQLVPAKKKLLISLALIIPVLFLFPLENYYKKNEFQRYKKMVKYSGFWPEAAVAWEWLNSHTTGNNIAYIGRPVPFPLYGSNFKNNVYYVSVNKIEPARLHNFAHSKYNWGKDFSGQHRNYEQEGNYRSQANYADWLVNLNKRRTEYLFVYSLHQTEKIGFPIEDNWAKTHPGYFLPVFANETIHIYKIAVKT